MNDETGHPSPTKKYKLLVKRSFDLVVSAFFLLLFLPFLVLIAILIRLDSRGPVFYHHKRVGRDGHPFDLIKFRSMAASSDDSEYMQYLKALIESERNGNGERLPYRKMSSDARVTRVGAFLRKYYLDELPQFWNIFVGDMSLIGPRPHVQFEVNYYSPEQRRRLSVRPGATGLWQVRGKGNSTFNELIALDLDYVDHWGLGLDAKIFLQTFLLLIHGGEGFWTRTEKTIPLKKSKPEPQNAEASGRVYGLIFKRGK